MDTYPKTPGFKERGGASEEAAASVSNPHALRHNVYALIKREPLTADEVARRLGKPILSIRPRLSELRAEGKIEATGKRRRNDSGKSAAVWMALR
jgi:predicted Rossmann fold nucleotide-binding protein DprA/Smf involved in DNA uptake